MLSRTACKTSAIGSVDSVIQRVGIRHRRTLAYPFYSKPGNIPPTRGGRKQTVFKRLMDQFLGPKNYKGDYYLNKYTYPKTNCTTNYIDPRGERGDALLKVANEFDDEDASASRASRKHSMQPFPFNNHCFTNAQISAQTKTAIVNDILLNKMSSQQAALKYGLKIQRIEAILKLRKIEEEWNQLGLVQGDLEKMARTMSEMLPVYVMGKNAENLTEIPVPKETAQSRFLTIAESEPFGPVDAAREFGLEPAAVTLQKLSEGGEHSAHTAGAADATAKAKANAAFLAPSAPHDRSVLKFTPVKTGQVGYRYGRVNRDNRKNRPVAYDPTGRAFYPL